MKLLVVIASFIISSVVFADGGWSKPWVHCDTISLSGDGMQYTLYLNKEEESLNSEIPFTVEAFEKDYDGTNFVKSEGSFKVDVLNKWFLEAKQTNGWGMAGHWMTKVRQYALSIHVTSDRIIGHKIQGCIPQPLKEIDMYLLCSESTSKRIPFNSSDLENL